VVAKVKLSEGLREAIDRKGKVQALAQPYGAFVVRSTKAV
jgi:hypothetical protein